MALEDYHDPGFHNLTITASNLITPHVVTKTFILDVLLELILEPPVMVVMNNKSQHTLPNDPVSWLLNVTTGSRVTFDVSCSNGADVSSC